MALSEDQFWTQRHAGFDLYSGRSGIGLFLAYAGILTDRPRALETALTVADGVVLEVEEIFARAHEPKRIWIVKASDHGFSDNLTEFDQCLLDAITWTRQHTPQ